MKPTNLNPTSTDMVTAVGLTTEQHFDLGNKIAEKGGDIYVNGLSPGNVAQWVVDNLSDEEILFLALQNIATLVEKAADGKCTCPACMASKGAAKLPKELKDFLKAGGKGKKKGKKLDKVLGKLAKDGKAVKFPGGIMKVVRKEDVLAGAKSGSLSDILSMLGKKMNPESKNKFEEMLNQARAKKAATDSDVVSENKEPAITDDLGSTDSATEATEEEKPAE